MKRAEESNSKAVSQEESSAPQRGGGSLSSEERNQPPARYGMVVVIIVVSVGILLWLLGVIQREGLSGIADFFTARGGDLQTVLIDSRDGKILMLETDGEIGRVLVQTSGQAGWLLVSRDDTTASNPALSPDGKWVAYVTEHGDGQLVVVSLIGDIRHIIDADKIQDAGKSVGLDNMELCPWTPIAWAPTDDRIAFFACVVDDLSVSVVGDLSGPAIPLTTIAASRVESSAVRQVRWLDEKRLVVSTPVTDARQAAVTTFDVR